MASRQRTIEQTAGTAPTIGVAIDERTHYAHARYAMSDKAGVIWYDPRDGREKFRVPGVPADVDLSVGERVLTHVSIHPKRACCQVVDPAEHEWVVEFNIKTREVFERPPDLPDREYTAHYAKSVTYETVRAARAAAGERCVAYADAEYRNAVEERTSEELVTDGGENEADGVPDQYREVADESEYRIPPGCPHCDKSARAYYLGDVGMTEDDVFITGWVCSACETPITLYSKGKGGDFVDERPDLDCLDNIETPRGDDYEQSELITDGGYRPPCEAVAHMDPTPPNANEYDLERRACPNCRLYFDVGAETDKVFCSGACRKRHERGELIADGGVDRGVLNDHVGDDSGPREDSELELDDHMACKECGLTLRWDAVCLYGFQRCPECYMEFHRKRALRAFGTLDSLEAVPYQTIPDDAEDDDTQLVADGGTCHEPTPTADADLPRTNAGTPLPELRFVDRFATDDDMFYAVTEENGTRLYRVTGETTIVRGLLAHDAVIHEPAGDGAVTTPAYNEQYGTIDLYHHMGGREASLRADRILDEPVITLAEVERV